MTVVAHSSDDAPVLFLIGYGFRPAYQPADYIGPRMDCPMWLPVPDADAAYLAKWDGPLKYEMTPLDIIPESEMGRAIREMGEAKVTPGQPSTYKPPHWGWPPSIFTPPGGGGKPPKCECVVVVPDPKPDPDTPIQPAPVPIPASGICILVGIAALAALKRKRGRT